MKATKTRLPVSIAARLVLGCGLLGMASIVSLSAVFYFGTIGVLDKNVDRKISALSERLMTQFESQSSAALEKEVRRQLSDGIDSDNEIFLLLSPQHQRVAGNLDSWPVPVPVPVPAPVPVPVPVPVPASDNGTDSGTNNNAGAAPEPTLHSLDVLRDGKPMLARLMSNRLADGGLLVVGRDLSEQEAIRLLVWRSLAAGILLALLLTVAGALLFRRQIESRIGDIRRTAQGIEAGDLSRRIPISGNDEFGMLNGDINRMLDRIEHLMDGVRHVSNAIAHDLRTPLGRIRSKLDDAVRHEMSVDIMAGVAHDAIAGIDDLIALFERLLQIAEAESGMRTQMFDRIDLNKIATDIAEMFEASAEEAGVRLTTSLHAAPALVNGERNLLASAVASLIDNAIKYAGTGATIDVQTRVQATMVSIAVCDNGPGIPASEHINVLQRFYRLDKSRSQPGNGLGLSIVNATATLHGGTFNLANGNPGLIARITIHQAALAG